MKTKNLIFCLLMLCIGYMLNAQTTAIPDPNFENYLETHASDGAEVQLGDETSMGDGIANNGLVLTNRINAVVFLDVSDLGISDLTGIEDFIDLENLLCSNNQLVTLDISNNINLISVTCGSNNLDELVIDNNINLETLDCSDNQIQAINISNNTVLKRFTASGNQIQNIDVSNNIELTLLSISNNRIDGDLIVNNNTNLESLFCASNQITSIDLSNNALLSNLDASDNAIVSLDLSFINSEVCPDPQTDPLTICQDISSINVSRNQLSSLIVSNSFNDLISVFNASENPDLFCIQIDAGFIPNGWIKDDWAYYSDVACVDIYTYVPDDNFEQALINQGYDDVIDNFVLTANIDALVNLDVSGYAISSLLGIEDFAALESLNCSTNNLESVDLTSNIALQDLDFSDNNLETIDLSTNTALNVLDCADNALTEIDLSANTNLTTLNCSGNALTQLEVNANTFLEDLNCSNNQIEDLNISTNVNLISVLVNNNNLFALNIANGTNPVVITFNATNNPNLFCIKVDDVAFANAAAGWQKDANADYNLDCGTYVPDDNFEQALIDQGIDSDGVLNNFVPTADVNTILSLDVSGLNILDLTGIEDFIALQDLNVSNNMLSNLELSSNTLLQILDCSINQIIDLDLTQNTALTSVLCGNNTLRTLNVENSNNAALTVFNTTGNPNLFCINVDDAIVNAIPGSWQKDDFTDYDGNCVNNRFTLIPDPAFEQALIDLEIDNLIDGQVLTANIEHIQTLDVGDESISDLTGIQDFRSIVELDCSSNFLDELDVSNLVFLERLNCSSNYFLTNDNNNPNGLLNTQGTMALTELYCASNNLGDLDTSQNNNLVILDCSDNNLNVLNVTGNTSLRDLNCSNNNLSDLDVSSNILLEQLNCDSNDLDNVTTIVTNNTSLISLSCINNNLTNLLLDNYSSLETLSCGTNELAQLNLSANVALSYLSATNNQISDLNLQNNISLVHAFVDQNSLTQLNISANTLLEQLNCSFNELTQLDVSQNVMLEMLRSSNNELTDIDASSNVNLVELDLSANAILTITLANNLESLKSLNLSNNQIEGDIDLTSFAISACVFQAEQTEFCPENISVNLSNNLLDFVNIQNGINSEIFSFNASSNPNLECIQVDDVNNVPANWIKDETTDYNLDCNFGETYVPDDNFEQALINLGYDVGPLNDYVPTINIESITVLDISGNAISDLTGLEDFLALENFNCSNNTISEIDLSANTNLLEVNCSNNLLDALDISGNTLISNLNCSNNSISSLDLTANTDLTVLDISNNIFTSFNPADVLSLQVFNCDNNAIVELDFQQNQNLVNISCQSNALDTLNIRNGQNAILTDLIVINNPGLMCVESDTGTVPAGATWTIDATTQFAIECFFGETFVPDDNFEQALIDLGFDQAPLDDYVPTENIENLTFLNVSSREINDLTGIEDFLNLASLNISENSISIVDLSNNVLLSNLNVSDNFITDLDLSFFPNLTTLNVAQNELIQLDFTNNLNLINLNVSNNLITALDTSTLFNLEDLSCASNAISNLDLTQNPNLSIILCQSNQLVGDQLNLQNGNNENIMILNATNNPGLGCILVDNPVAVIENTNGTYDNWSKDESANYQLVCEDADNDGVPNDEDLCPGTPFGAPIDLFGCAIIDLPADNFTVAITGETCLNSNNGKIRIEAQELYNYTATLTSDIIIPETGESFYEEYNFTNDVDIFNLLSSTYELCITIEEWPDYEVCYTVVITEPNPLDVFASRIASSNNLVLDMSGSDSYNIEFNGEIFTTYNPNLELQLQKGENNLKVTTDIDCQGTFEKRIFYGNEYLVYPNPFKDQFYIYNGLEDDLVVKVYSFYGQLILRKSFENKGAEIPIQISNLEAGMYIVDITSENASFSYKLFKK